MARFRKRPVEIEAMHWLGHNTTEAADFMSTSPTFGCPPDGLYWVEIETLEGTMRAEPGDWIVKGIKGEFYPVKPDIFEATYEPVESG